MYLILHEGVDRRPLILRSNTILMVSKAAAAVPDAELGEGCWNEKAWVTVNFVHPDTELYGDRRFRATEDFAVCETVEEIAQLLHAQGTLELP